MPTILRRPRASADLSEIWEFIAQENTERADAFIDRIDEKFRVLAAQPLVAIARNSIPEIIITAFTLPEANASTKILSRLGFNYFGNAHDPDAGDV